MVFFVTRKKKGKYMQMCAGRRRRGPRSPCFTVHLQAGFMVQSWSTFPFALCKGVAKTSSLMIWGLGRYKDFCIALSPK